MRLCITTQVVDSDDPVLGFFHRWIEELATHFESIEVICLQEGRHALPQNVRVHSLGKERGRASRLVYATRFLRVSWRLRHQYDRVFVHMNPEYAVLAGILWRLSRKRIVLWYTHRQVTLMLRTALLLCHAVATAAPESLRLRSPKVHVIGHGIDTRVFTTSHDGTLHDPLRVVSVGRITPIKRLETLLDALALLKARGLPAELVLIGASAMPRDEAYQRGLIAQARALGIETQVRFAGARPYRDMPEAYRTNDISINLAPTGGIDKAVLESMAAGIPALVANEAFRPLFGADASALMFDSSPSDLADTVEALVVRPNAERARLSERLAETARTQADLGRTIGRLVALLS